MLPPSFPPSLPLPSFPSLPLLQPNPFGAARPREQVIAERQGVREADVLNELVKKEWKPTVGPPVCPARRAPRPPVQYACMAHIRRLCSAAPHFMVPFRCSLFSLPLFKAVFFSPPPTCCFMGETRWC